MPRITAGKLKLQINILNYLDDRLLKKCANAHNGEYEGPCPFCGGTDRFHVQPEHPNGGRWFCRQCTGDPEDNRWLDVFDLVQKQEHISFEAAFEMVKGDHYSEPNPPAKPKPKPTEPVDAWPDPKWIAKYTNLVKGMHQWMPFPSIDHTAVRYLMKSRAISERSYNRFKIGSRRILSIKEDHLSLPYYNHDQTAVYGIRYRRVGHGKKRRYMKAPGSTPALFGLHLCTEPTQTLIVIEGEINAISVDQALNTPQLSNTAHVVSYGAQKGLKSALPCQQLTELIERYQYQTIISWADNIQSAAAVATVVEKIKATKATQVNCIATKKDANQWLQANPSGHTLREYIGKLSNTS